jgi:hypothetical protein
MWTCRTRQESRMFNIDKLMVELNKTRAEGMH